MPKLFVSDIDGTLLPPGQGILSDKTVSQLRKLVSLGVVTALASGRSYDSVQAVFPDGKVPEDLYIISNDGALLTHAGKALYHKPISPGTLMRMSEAAKQSGAGFFCRCDDTLVYGESGIFSRCGAFAEAKGQRVYDVHRHECVYKIGIVDENKIGDIHLLPQDLRCAYDDGFLREYVSKYASKVTALEDLQTRVFAHREDTFVCGDGINDVCMIPKAKISAAVGKAHEQMKKACNMYFATGDETLEWYLANM